MYNVREASFVQLNMKYFELFTIVKGGINKIFSLSMLMIENFQEKKELKE